MGSVFVFPSSTNCYSSLFVGGKKSLPRGLPKEYYDGFDGCIDFFEIDGQRLNLETDRKGDSSPIRYCR